MKEHRISIDNIYSNKKYFKETTWQCLNQCLKTFDNYEYLSTGIWAAVFTEALVGDCLQESGINTEKLDLYNMIKRLKNSGNTEDEKRAFNYIYGRASQIRSNRNRLVHDSGTPSHSIKDDATSMYNDVICIVEEYLDTAVAEKVYRSNMGSKGLEIPKLSYKAFISTITPHSVEQVAFIAGFCDRLEENGIEPVRCKFDDFGQKDPMGKVCGMIKECDAFITIGLERSHAYYYRDNEGTKDEEESTHRRYTSSWLQLESGMAIALEKPIFILRQESLFGEGIFDSDWNSYVVQTLSLPLDVYDDKVDKLLDELKKNIEERKKKQKAFDKIQDVR